MMVCTTQATPPRVVQSHSGHVPRARQCWLTLYYSYCSPQSRGEERLDVLLCHTTVDNRWLFYFTLCFRRKCVGGRSPLRPAFRGAVAPRALPASYASVYHLHITCCRPPPSLHMHESSFMCSGLTTFEMPAPSL